MRIRFFSVLAALTLVACGGGVVDPDGGPPPDSGGRDGGPDATRPDGGADGGRDGGGCVDEDGDGYGDGCALGPDCDDDDAAVNPGATERCNGVDDDCDDAVDEDVDTPRCERMLGVCAGATARCGPTGFLDCDGSDYGADFEEVEAACDGLDNDCDGTVDEGCTCEGGTTQPCGSDVGVCTRGVQTCVDSSFGACEGEIAPTGEVCDGLDNDCDGVADEPSDLTPPACPLQLGVCGGSRRACGGTAGWVACSGIASYGGDYQATETLCDGLDNDCDGVVDEGCACVDGTTQPCGSDVGACMRGTQTCVAGGFGGCAGSVGPATETCDGLDNDCNGTVDDGLVAPPCALQLGVCSGRTQRCTGAGGFAACTASDYGSSYQATETLCDGVDNDCDGTVDEGCACVDGATQACGSAVGVCRRGTQTCVAGAWGACTGGVVPGTETCNGLDDDCNGVVDDGLVAPACALTSGVCDGSRQTCGGAAGWQPCSGTDSYGPRYLSTEDGSTSEVVCDGLDNDCDGVVDNDCVSGPVVSIPEDAVVPAISNRNLAYSVNYDGNWDIVFQNLDRGSVRRLTTTPLDEISVRISGDRLVFIRGDGAARRAVLYDLVTDAETALSTVETGSVDIAGRFAVWDELVAGRWSVVAYDLADSTRTVLTSGTDAYAPSVRASTVSYTGTTTGTPRVHVVEYDASSGSWSAPTLQSATGAGGGQQAPYHDFVGIAWTDGRAITGTPTLTSDWDLYGAFWGTGEGFATFPSASAIETSLGAQIVRGLDSQILVFDDHRNGNWDVGAAFLGTPGTFLITTSAATQGAIALSGAHLVWHDNRLGSFDIYQSFFTGALFAPGEYAVFIAEVLADPAPGADVNGDGVASTTQDELVEIISQVGQPIDLSGMTLSDAVGVRHVFPPGTNLPAYGMVVVFGGGTPRGTFGGAVVQVASTGTLSLNNDGDTLTLRRADGTQVDLVAYGTEANNDQSIVRSGLTEWVRHLDVPGSIGRWSPGLLTDGFVH